MSDLENTLLLELKDGTVTIALRPDLAPQHVSRIKELARQGYYDGLNFHRVIPGFMAQGGCPDGNGTGGSFSIFGTGSRIGDCQLDSDMGCHVGLRRCQLSKGQPLRPCLLRLARGATGSNGDVSDTCRTWRLCHRPAARRAWG